MDRLQWFSGVMTPLVKLTAEYLIEEEEKSCS
jgi:hypothetical protein